MAISDELKKLRKKSKLTISECAFRIEVSQSTYRDWEQGRAISGEPYINISKIFKVSLSELFGAKAGDTAQELKRLQDAIDDIAGHIKNIRARL